jgi:NAD(P)-dependent dehydrogenase (short-subunit alcohol dehydrogenase family)
MKKIIITGANGNLGSAVTKFFLEKSYTLIATVENEEAKKQMPPHDNLQVEAVNLENETEAALFVQNIINAHGNIDAALMLVGGFTAGNIENTKTGDIKKQIALNFETAYNIVHPLYKRMLQNGYGRLVFIGARPALQAVDGKNLVAYALSKSLLFKLAEFINKDAKGKNITATVVVPSTIDTAINRKNMPDADPNNWVKAEDLAEILEFVCSDKAGPLRETVLKVYNNA